MSIRIEVRTVDGIVCVSMLASVVTFAELRAAQPGLWSTAANDILVTANQCDRTEDEIHISQRDLSSNVARVNSKPSKFLVAQMNSDFDSPARAARANPGFTTGSQLVGFSMTLQSTVTAFIRDLTAGADGIVKAAQSLASADHANTEGFNRELAALNGLSQQPRPGR